MRNFWTSAVLGLTTVGSVVTAETGDMALVTYGTVLKLKHLSNAAQLHSHEIAYGSGSGQQSVTGNPSLDDAGSYWVVQPAEGYRPQGTPIKKGSGIKLQHGSSRKWLHSHLHISPLSNNQEVSCFGGEGKTDTGDVWLVEWDKSEANWSQDQRVQLRHKDTDQYLASGSRQFGRPISGQFEVYAKGSRKAADTWWTATEGVFFPPRTADSDL